MPIVSIKRKREVAEALAVRDCECWKTIEGLGCFLVPRQAHGYLGAQYRRLARRRGRKKALVAVAHSILVIVYHILKDGTTYRDLGHDYFDKRDTARLQRRLIARLEALGLRVTVEPLAHAA